MTTDSERLTEANACHDDDPERCARILRSIDVVGLDDGELPAYAFLLNHVLGEKLGCWAEALTRLRQALGRPAPAPVLWRQLGAAACAAGDDGELQRAAEAFAQESQAQAPRAMAVIRLSAAVFQVPRMTAGRAAARTMELIGPMQDLARAPASALDRSAAAGLNNLASGLLDRRLADLRHADLRAAVTQCAQLAQTFWHRAGDWVHHERALYLRVLAANALGELQAAREYAREALAILDANDREHAEDVDRAFIELERAHACRLLGLAEEAETAGQASKAIADAFDQAWLTDWYQSRCARLAELPA